ncbi:hypothetical protein BJY04DRAFT_214573 [Aspergillus karnatakaensis]|uniref:uncharacterized protein n=1 Tax=Aspergillus karnatakaensis TaxID=1810916 RepID=UPI003CCCEE26
MNNQDRDKDKDHPKQHRKRFLELSPLTTEQNRRNTHCPSSDSRHGERCQARMAEYWASKARALKEPFRYEADIEADMEVDSESESESENDTEDADTDERVEETETICGSPAVLLGEDRWMERSSSRDLPLRGVYDGTIKRQEARAQHLQIPQYQYDMTMNHPPLSNNAIADILRTCNPGSPRAQAWINAHEASKAAMGMRRVQLDERGSLRRQVLALRVRTENPLPMPRGSKQDEERSREISSGTIFKEEKEDVQMMGAAAGVRRPKATSATLDEKDKQTVRVFSAGARLQKIICDDEDPARQNERIHRSFLEWYKGR